MLIQVLGILSLWFLRGLWDPFRLLIFKLPRRVKVPQLLQVGIQRWGRFRGVAASDPDSRLPIFLVHFDLLEFNSLPTGHFHSFGPYYGSFLHFSVPVKGLPLLEGLLKSHGDFTNSFKRGVFLGNILMELLCAVLISLRDSSLDSLSEEKLLEWRGVVHDLLEAKFNLSVLLEHLPLLAHMLFQRQASRSIDAEIATAEEALARAHKVLQDLKVKRQRVLSSSAIPTISPDGSLLAGLIP